MTSILESRHAWLRSAHDLAGRLGRPIVPMDLADLHGVRYESMRNRVGRAVRDGYMMRGRKPNAFASAPIRLTPKALLELDLPMLVYLAWPVDRSIDNYGIAAASWIQINLGIVTVSPCFRDPTAMSIAVVTAQRSDAVIVWRDRLLVGRADVVAGANAGAPVAVIPGVGANAPRSASELWIPPFLQPALHGQK